MLRRCVGQCRQRRLACWCVRRRLHASAALAGHVAASSRIAAAISVALFIFWLWSCVDAAGHPGVEHACRAGWSGASIRSPILASRAGSCGRSAFCFSRWRRCRRRLTRMSQAVLAAVMVRVGFLFARHRRAGPVRHHRQAHDRPRPAAGRRRASILTLFAPIHLARRLCQPAVRPRHHRLFGAGGIRHVVAARAHGAVDLCAGDRVEPGRGDWRIIRPTCWPAPWSARSGALMVRRWFALRRLGFSDRAGRHTAPISRALRCKRIKSVARELLAP